MTPCAPPSKPRSADVSSDARRHVPWSLSAAAGRLLEAPKNRRREHRDSDSETPPPVSARLQEGGPPGSLSSSALALRLPPEDDGRARRALSAFLLFVLVACAGVLALARTPHQRSAQAAGHTDVVPADSPLGREAEPPLAPAPHASAAISASALESEERADATLRRDGQDPVPGGSLFVPKTFSSASGEYDLLIHFHGNAKVIADNAEAVGLNAIVAVLNLGLDAQPYTREYAAPSALTELRRAVERAVEKRGLRSAKLHRLALSSWSGGVGALQSILEAGSAADVDALLVAEGPRSEWSDDKASQPSSRQLEPFAKAALRARDGRMLFAIAHADLEPTDYASAAKSGDWLLGRVGAHREPKSGVTPFLSAPAAPELGRSAPSLELRSEGKAGSFVVRGYSGTQRDDHVAHLLQIGATLYTQLANRWDSTPR